MIYHQFLEQWDTKYHQVPFILSYIKSYPQLISKLKGFNLLDEKEVEASQKEWLLLMDKFDNPLEKDFFNPWYVPVLKDGYDLFIDLSSPGFTLFEIHFFAFPPYTWTKKIWFKNISDFLLAGSESDIQIEVELKKNERVWKKEIKDLFQLNKEVSK